ncbi:MAG TPA: response regulator, partial [Spirochaetia bacterium]|nr:response regulator [Spirochaetia bacterium]
MGSVRYKVLIVEDETYIRNSLVRLIDWESIDCVVVNSCESGEEAQEYIRTNEVDIVVSDIRMEGMSGLDLAKAIKD